MKVKIVKEIPVEDAIYNMLNFTRSDYDWVCCIKKDGTEQTALEHYREAACVRTDIGMVNMVDGVEPSQVLIYPNTKFSPEVSNWEEAAIWIWFTEYSDWFEKEVAKLKKLCKEYPEYQKHYGKYFGKRG